MISNGPMERANRDIKTILRLSFVFSNFHRMRNRIMLVMNEIQECVISNSNLRWFK